MPTLFYDYDNGSDSDSFERLRARLSKIERVSEDEIITDEPVPPNPTLDRLQELQKHVRRSNYWIPEEELDFLNAVAVQNIGEDFCRKLFKTPGYLSPNGKWWTLGNGIAISLDTGRFFIEDGEKGTGNPLLLWRTIRELSFFDAVRELTDWCINQEKGVKTEPERKRESKEQPSWTDLKICVARSVFKNGKRRTPENSGRHFWKQVQAEYKEGCAESKYFASAIKFKELLEIWRKVNDQALFKVEKKTRFFKDPRRNRTTEKPVFVLTLTGFPLETSRRWISGSDVFRIRRFLL